MNNTLLFWNLVGWSAAALVFELIRRQLWAKPNKELLEIMNKSLRKPWRQTPLAADIPRLARKITIHLPTQLLTRKDEVVPAMEQLFVALTEHFEGPEAVKEVHQAFHHEAKDYGPETVDHSRLAADFVGVAFEKYQKSMHVARLCCQDILAPAAIQLKREFDEHAPFKDMRGHWFIDIYLDDNSRVRVKHSKREQAFSHEESDRFEFLWELTVTLSPDLLHIDDVNIKITDLSFVAEMPQAKRAAIRAVMWPYLATQLR